MYIEQVPKHAPKALLPGLKIGALVKTTKPDYSQDKNFNTKALPAGAVGRVKKIFDFGTVAGRGGARFLCSVKFEGHPLSNFYTYELAKVRI